MPRLDASLVVQNLYRAAKTKSLGDMSKIELLKSFDQKLSNAIWKVEHGEDLLDFDILYNAQDTQIRNFRILKGSPQTAALSNWNVSFTNFGKKESLTVELTNVKGKGWRISEITFGDGSTLSNVLTGLIRGEGVWSKQ